MMNEKEFYQQLDRIAEEDTPENLMLWGNIESQLLKENSMNRLANRGWLRYVVAFVAVLLVTSAAYAYYHFQSGVSDPSLPDNLVSEVGISQTVDDVTVTLDWAYADAQRIALAFTTSYMSDVPFLSDNMCASCSAIVSLETADGTVLPPAFGGGGGGGGGEVPPNEAYLISFSSGLNFDASGITHNSDTIALVLSVTYDPQNPMQYNLGGGGGGGSVEPTAAPTLDPADIPLRTYRFEFTIPFYQAKTGTVDNATMQANGINFVLKNIQVTPSMIRFEMCYTLPTPDEWYANILVYTGSESALYATQQIAPLVDLDGRTVYQAFSEADVSFDNAAMQACADFIGQGPYENGDIEIMIPYLSKSNNIDHLEESTVQNDQAYFDDLGIHFDYRLTYDLSEAHRTPTGSTAYPVGPMGTDEWYIISITSYPQTMTADEAMQYLVNNWWRERYQTGIKYNVHLDN